MKKIISLILVALVTVTCFAFTACTPFNIDKATAKMKEEGYTVIDYPIDSEGFVGGIYATKAGNWELDMIHAVLFDSVKSAKDYYENKADKSSAIQKGRWVYWGTEDAIDDFD
jgi:hypothetical protein